jgi:hypothetical protein
MTVVDARSGRDVAIGQTVRYAGAPGADWQLLGIVRGNPIGDALIVIRRLSDSTIHRVPCPVRWFIGGRVLPVILAPT